MKVVAIAAGVAVGVVLGTALYIVSTVDDDWLLPW